MPLDRAWIERHIPHRGRMCLLDEVIEWDAEHIRCRSASHRASDHPLRSHGRLGVACGIEYAAQAMAVHGALAGGAATGVGIAGSNREAAVAAMAGGTIGNAAVGTKASGSSGVNAARAAAEVGFLASLRDVRFHVLRLDDIDADLLCNAALVAGDPVTALYEFSLWSEARKLLSGRATVVLNVNKRLKV